MSYTIDPKIFGENVFRGRKQKGWSMDQLSAMTGNKISKAAIAKIEAGLVMPREKTIWLLMEAFGMRPDYFFRAATVRSNITGLVRSRAYLSEREQHMILEDANQFLEAYVQIEQMSLSRKDFVNPLSELQPVVGDMDAEDAADFVRHLWHLGEGALGSVCEIFEERHIKIHMADIEIDFEGMTALIGSDEPVFIINKTINSEHKRFTLLFELAGLILRFPDEMKTSEAEKLCARFAGAVLLPAKVLYALIGKKREQIYLSELIQIRNTFGISLGAAMHRLLELRIIGLPLYTRFKTYIQDNPNETGQGGCTIDEKPQRFERLVLQALSRRIITLGHAADLLQCKQTELDQEIKWSNTI